MNRTVTLGRYALEWERDGYKPLPVNWYQDGFCVPELPDEIEDELYELACEDERESRPVVREIATGGREEPNDYRIVPSCGCSDDD